MFFAQSGKREAGLEPTTCSFHVLRSMSSLRVELTLSLDKRRAPRYNIVMSESINLPTFTDESLQVSVDPTGWRTHSHWHALCNYIELLDSRYSQIARIMIDNILAIMRADFERDVRESKLQREVFNYRQRLLRKYAPAAHRPESFIV
jgi:hypothetical protein